MRDDGGDMGEMTGEMTGGIKTLSRATPHCIKAFPEMTGEMKVFSSFFEEYCNLNTRILQSQHENTSISTREYCNPNAIILLSRSKLPA